MTQWQRAWEGRQWTWRQFTRTEGPIHYTLTRVNPRHAKAAYRGIRIPRASFPGPSPAPFRAKHGAGKKQEEAKKEPSREEGADKGQASNASSTTRELCLSSLPLPFFPIDFLLDESLALSGGSVSATWFAAIGCELWVPAVPKAWGGIAFWIWARLTAGGAIVWKAQQRGADTQTGLVRTHW